MDQFDDIWRKYYPRITVFLKSSFGFTETEDLVQEIMLRVYKNLDSYSRRYSFNTWIYTIARNHAIDFIKKQESAKKATEAVIAQASISPFGTQHNPENIALEAELQSAIEGFVAGRTELQRQISFLKFHEQLKYREIAKITGIPAGTVKYHIHIIRKDFRTFYGEHYES